MSTQVNQVKDAVEAYLDKRAKEDALFAASYAKPNKSIDECFDYIIGEARKKGTMVYMSDEEVFGMAVHYYDEDCIKISKISEEIKASAKMHVELTEEEKKKAREQAIEEYRRQCIKAEDEAAKERAKKREAKRNILALKKLGMSLRAKSGAHSVAWFTIKHRLGSVLRS